MGTAQANGQEQTSAKDVPTGWAHRKQGGLLFGYPAGDVGNAHRFLERYRDRVRYCEEEKDWYWFDGKRWAGNSELLVRRKMHDVLRLMAEQAKQYHGNGYKRLRKLATDFHRSAKITNALKEAKPYVPVKSADFDTQPHLLNFQNGTVDLRDGLLHKHNAKDMLSRALAWDYDPDALCPQFDRFLLRAMGGVDSNDEYGELQNERATRLADYVLQRLGYSLSGDTSEKATMWCVGPKDTSKTTLLNLVRELLGEYASLIQIESLMSKYDSQMIQQDLWSLRGRRFVMTSEAEKGQKLSAARLRRITQGQGVIKVIPKYMGEIIFRETHKLWVDANYRPIVQGGKETWERLHCIPFETVIPKIEQNKQLVNELLTNEGTGILATLVRYCGLYYVNGLQDIPEVDEARKKWEEESDLVERYLTECCACDLSDKELRCLQTELWHSFLEYLKTIKQEEMVSKAEFEARLQEKGFVLGYPTFEDGGKKAQQRGWFGVCPLVFPPVAPDPD